MFWIAFTCPSCLSANEIATTVEWLDVPVHCSHCKQSVAPLSVLWERELASRNCGPAREHAAKN
jgi:transcription elongation factor Elf1